jgi:pyruvate dehydrogenase E1 component beta subunit
MAEEMRTRPDRVYLMGEEVAEYQGAYKVSQGLLQEFGAQRVIDTPITEHGFTGLAVGSAMNGLKPIVEFMTWNFRHAGDRPDHQLGRQDAIHVRRTDGLPDRVPRPQRCGVARWPRSTRNASRAGTRTCPGLKVVAPWSAADAKGLLKAAIRDPNPVIFLENELMYGQSFEAPVNDNFVIPIGRAKIEREGNDVTIVAYSIMVGKALKAAEQLAEEGISAEVINLRTIRPLDRYTIIESVKKTNRIVSVEESWPFAGIGSEIAALCMEHAFDYLDAPVTRVCAADVPLPYAANLEALALPQAEHIIEAVRKVCYAN